MRTSFRKISWICIASGITALAACGDTEPDVVVTDTSDTADNDTSDGTENDTTDTSPDGDVAPDTNSCETECNSISDCRSAGFDNPRCVDNCCEEIVAESCEEHLAACDSSDDSNLNFFCDFDAASGEGTCLQRCDFDTAADTQSADCPNNSYCLAELQVTDEGGNGACIPGDCDSNIFDPDACDGVGTCFPVGHGASFCIDAGTADVGDPCQVSEEDVASDVCLQGLLCSNNVCVRPCDRSAADPDATCADGETCLDGFDITPRNRPGLCGVECTPFSADECSPGSSCQTITGRFGINTWACVEDVGEIIDPETEECIPGENSCPEGYICLTDGDTGECAQACDPARESEEAFGRCAAGSAAGADVTGLFAFGEATDYLALAEGAVSFELRTGDGTFVGPVQSELSTGEVRSVIAYLNEDGGVGTFDVEDRGIGDTLPVTGWRGIHAVDGAGEVDLYVGVVEASVPVGSAFSAAFDNAADYRFHGLTNTTAVEFSETLVRTDARAIGAQVYAQAGDETVSFTYARNADLAGAAAVNFVHAIGGGPAVDIYLCAADCTGEDRVAANVTAATSLVGGFTNVAAGAYEVLVLAAGTDVATATAEQTIASADLTFAADSVNVLAAVAGAGGPAAAAFVLDEPADANETVVMFINGTSAALNFVSEADTAAASGLAFGATTFADDNYGEVGAGTYHAIARLADDSLFFLSPAFEIEASTLNTLIIAGSADGAELVHTVDTFAVPTTGGAIRAIHAAPDAPSVKITEPALADTICVESAIEGFGFCQESCQPYPRGAEQAYGCSDDQSCQPYRFDQANFDLATEGFCAGPIEGQGPFELCDEPGFFDAECADRAVCLDVTDDADDSGQCLPICEPWGAECPEDGVCSLFLPLNGELAWSFCFPADIPQAGAAGDRCSEESALCSEDMTLCLNSECIKFCRRGLDDCAEGQTCDASGLNPEAVPSYIGICQ